MPLQAEPQLLLTSEPEDDCPELEQDAPEDLRRQERALQELHDLELLAGVER